MCQYTFVYVCMYGDDGSHVCVHVCARMWMSACMFVQMCHGGGMPWVTFGLQLVYLSREPGSKVGEYAGVDWGSIIGSDAENEYDNDSRSQYEMSELIYIECDPEYQMGVASSQMGVASSSSSRTLDPLTPPPAPPPSICASLFGSRRLRANCKSPTLTVNPPMFESPLLEGRC